MRNYFSRGLISVLLIVCVLLSMVPVSWADEAADTEPYTITDDVPAAADIEHVHNSEGWQCYLTCDKEEHTHTIEECYNLICSKTEGEGHTHSIENGCYTLSCTEVEREAHTHSEDCFEIICEDTSEDHEHSVEAGCYKLICENDSEDHEHSVEAGCYYACGKEECEEHKHSIENGCYTLTCDKDEYEAHKHTIEDVCYELNCAKEEHTHNPQECNWVCATDYVLLTVEYYVLANNQEVRVAETFQSLLKKGDSYTAPIAALTEKGYKVQEIQRRTRGGGVETVAFDESAGDYTVSGTIDIDTKISVKYEYTDEFAPYQVDYWGCDVNGQNDELIYSYVGRGPKDALLPASETEVGTNVVPVQVNTLMQNLSDILADGSLGEGGTEFAANLIKAVDAKYNTQPDDGLQHDITPFLKAIAGGDDLSALGRQQLKAYVDDKVQKAYGFDQNRQNISDVSLVITADELAKRNLYYVPKMPQTVLFTTGVPEAKVNGIPQESSGEQAFAIETKENSITTQAEVDISAYTKNVWASHQSFLFMGWVTGEGAGVIRDYTEANALGKYKDLTIYTADGDGTLPALPAGVKTEKLADAAQIMPNAGATYYAVWKPFGSTYTVQLWFESDAGDNTYVESHALDIKDRMKPAAGTITFNSFDVARADESSVVAAANGAEGALFDAIVFADPEGGTTDTYHSYADYQNSPFFGFDFLECPVCAADPSACGTAGCTCGYQRDAGGNLTVERACNYQPVEVNASGDTILNLYYSREMWEIALDPTISLWSVECLERPTELNPYTYWIGGGRQKDLVDALNASSADNLVVIRGKYGVSVPEGYNNGIGEGSDPENVGSKWVDDGFGFGSYWIQAGTNILLANGSEAFQQSDKKEPYPGGVKRESGCYIYPQDTRTYISSANGTVAEPQDWFVPFNCLSTIEPGMFTGRTAEPDADSDTGYTRIQNGVSKWEGDRFDQESSYDLTTGTYTYGTHRLNIYPFFHGISDDSAATAKHTFGINYYTQALPHEEASAGYTYNAANGDSIKFNLGQTLGMEAPSAKLNYGAATPEGLVPLMWRASPRAFASRGGFQGNGVLVAAERYTYPQIVSTGNRLPYAFQVAPAYVNMGSTYGGYSHNASFNSDNHREMNGNSFYLSDWRQQYTYGRPTQDNASLANLDPSAYWVTDWIRAGAPGASSVRMTGTLTGENGLYSLIDKANAGDADAMTLRDQLESYFIAGAFFPTGAGEYIYAHRQNPNAFRYSSAGAFNTPVSLVNGQNAVAFARNQYTITYNTCYLNDDGVLVREPDGSIRTTAVHTTKYLKGSDNVISDKGDMIYYEQPLGYDPAKGAASVLASFDEFYYNYYDAYFAADSTSDSGFKWLGYANRDSGATGLGGYGKWYLDPDGTIPFTEENMANMPAGNIDVYYHYTKRECKIYFVDDLTGKDNEPVDNIEHVINDQTLTPGTKASHFAGDEPVDPDGALYFVGWFYDRGGAKPYTFDDEIPSDTTVYAIWRPLVPTEYKIRHVLVDDSGKEIKVIEDSDWIESYVGDTIDGEAKETEFYDDPDYAGIYLVPDDYSKTMVLKKDRDDNILTFRYKIPGKHYTVEFRDIDSKIEILPGEEINTKLSQATVGLKEIPGWTYQGYTVDDSKLEGGLDSAERQVTITVTEQGVLVTFWYQRIPIDDTIRVMKLLDDVALTDGTWFTFELVDENGKVLKTAQSVNGFADFGLAELKLDQPGIYHYTVREKNEGGHFKYDDTVYDIAVEVTQPDLAQPLEATISYYDKNLQPLKAEDLDFKNYRLPAEVNLTAAKYVNGQAGDGFTFLLDGGAGVFVCDKHVHTAGCYNRKLVCGLPEGPDHTHTDACYVLICGLEDDPAHVHSDACYEKELVCGQVADPDHPAHTRD